MKLSFNAELVGGGSLHSRVLVVTGGHLFLKSYLHCALLKEIQ